MTGAERARTLLIEPFDPERHDRSGFTSGIAQVDNFFTKTGNKLAQAGNLRVFVLIGDTGELIGFYALNAFAVDYQDLPRKFARTRPQHGQIPIAFISMVGVSEEQQGKGYGALLLADALKRIMRVSRDLGIATAMLDILDCGTATLVERRKALFMRYGFEPLPDQPLRIFLPLYALSAHQAGRQGA